MNFLEPLLAALLSSGITYFFAIRQFRSEKRFELQWAAFRQVFDALTELKLYILSGKPGQANKYCDNPKFRELYDRILRVMEQDRQFLPRRSWDKGNQVANLLLHEFVRKSPESQEEWALIITIDQFIADLAHDLELPYGPSLLKSV
jgi:hypothetical protein